MLGKRLTMLVRPHRLMNTNTYRIESSKETSHDTSHNMTVSKLATRNTITTIMNDLQMDTCMDYPINSCPLAWTDLTLWHHSPTLRRLQVRSHLESPTITRIMWIDLVRPTITLSRLP